VLQLLVVFISTTVATGGLDVMSAVKAAGGIYALFQGDENPDPFL
jgi:hypothetical protein